MNNITEKFNMKDSLFGKNYPTRRGASSSDKCSYKKSKTPYKPPKPRNLNELGIQRPGFTYQTPLKYVYDFDRMRADEIFKFGTKVDNRQLMTHTFKDADGKEVTKNISELSYEVSQKLTELQEIAKTGNNTSIEDKMIILNTMIEEINNKFRLLSKKDMVNISNIVSIMGDNLKYAKNIGLPRYLTPAGFAEEVKDREARMTLFLAGKFKEFGYLATIGRSNVKIYDTDELNRVMVSTPKALYDLDKLVIYTTLSWKKIGDNLKKAGNSGKIDGYEYDDHPKTEREEDLDDEKTERDRDSFLDFRTFP